jgi:hypothetical protein
MVGMGPANSSVRQIDHEKSDQNKRASNEKCDQFLVTD